MTLAIDLAMPRRPLPSLGSIPLGATLACALVASSLADERPILNSVQVHANSVLVAATVPSGYRHVVLEARNALPDGARESLVAGGLNAGEAVVTFSVPLGDGARFLRVQAGHDAAVPASTYTGPDHLTVTYLDTTPIPGSERVLQALNRLAYGPSAADVALVEAMGVGAYVEQQLDPESIDEGANQALRDAEADLFEIEQPHEDARLVSVGEVWRFSKGTAEPPAGWSQIGFDDTSWLQGPTGIGYGDDDDATVLSDMEQTATQAGYLSVYLRRVFSVPDPAGVDRLILRVDFDDGFVAYLNGVEVARANLAGTPPPFDRAASDNHEAGEPVEYDLTPHKGLLHADGNVLAFQAHNVDRGSSDLSLIPSLVSRTILPGDPLVRVRGRRELQQLVHVRGVLARRQLQAVLAEFWDNHFTTDYDKVADFFDQIENSDGTDAMSPAQAAAEGAQVEFEEYQFFHDHALGSFGDLLLFSSTSPAMLIYLDSVLNRKNAPNENYAREILELFGFGVDNRYTQRDIEELARCFTGWSLRKIAHDARPAFPGSARNPLTEPGVTFDELVMIEVGAPCRYFKGRSEPSPGPGAVPTLDWAKPEFDATGWLEGRTSVGYGDGDDLTILTDMEGEYGSVYLRSEFTVEAGLDLNGLGLWVQYDDGFVAYLNGTEVGRSESMQGAGTPPPFNQRAGELHEITEEPHWIDLTPSLDLVRRAPAVNVLAIQVHNEDLDSSDLSIQPRLLRRRARSGSIEAGAAYGAWVFRFDPAEHDTGPKQLFEGTPHAMSIPEGRTGAEGVRDAIDVIDAMVSHPSTREFICLKLINKFVSDDISLVSYHNQTAPEALRHLLDEAMNAWMSTTPPGHIETVLRAILRPQTLDGYFWSQAAFTSKIKTPVEFINSSLRALGAAATSPALPDINEALGMTLFTRDDPDGWSELGFDWMDTGSLLQRVRFLQALAGNLDDRMTWDVDAFVQELADPSASGVVDALNQFLYRGHMTPAQRQVLIRFATTDDAGTPLPFDRSRPDYAARVQELVALILALPLWHQQ